MPNVFAGGIDVDQRVIVFHVWYHDADRNIEAAMR
jgi:hypothetical protein